jgi:hypothetical protein
MNQRDNVKPPAKPVSIEEQLEFIRGARHLVNTDHDIVVTKIHSLILIAIEENLMTIKMILDQQKQQKEKPIASLKEMIDAEISGLSTEGKEGFERALVQERIDTLIEMKQKLAKEVSHG